MKAIIDAAHKRGKLAVVHIGDQLGAKGAINAGADGLAHLFANSEPNADFASLVAAHYALVIPTLTVLESVSGSPSGESLTIDPRLEPYLTPENIANLKRSFGQLPTHPSERYAETTVRELMVAQAPILAGTDSPNPGTAHGASIHRELANAGAQMYLPATKQFSPEGSFLVVRSSLPPASLAMSVMRTLREINPGQSSAEFRPIREVVDHATSPRRFFVLLVGVFAGLGLLLASLGIYGVITYSVTRQTQEIGIRMALGATQTSVLLDVIGKTLRLALIGIAIGAIASFALARLIASLLFRTAPTDPLTFVGMMVLLGSVALLAGYLPARRASKIDPKVALRTD